MTTSGPYEAIQAPHDDRIKVHVAGCADIAKIEARTGRSRWPLSATGLGEAQLEAGLDDAPITGDEGADVMPCAVRHARASNREASS